MNNCIHISSFRWLKLGWFAILFMALPAMALAFSNGDPNFSLVVTDSSGHALGAQQVNLKVELTTGSLTGEPQYAETHALKTDAAGIAAIAIGFGQPTESKYIFDNFNVAEGDNFVRVSVKDAGGWRLLLSTQLPNVPKVQKWLFADSKSNTVIAVMIVVWLGIVVYLLLSSRKVKQLEQQVAALKQGRGA